jgi:hypothetical protein
LALICSDKIPPPRCTFEIIWARHLADANHIAPTLANTDNTKGAVLSRDSVLSCFTEKRMLQKNMAFGLANPLVYTLTFQDLWVGEN